MKRLTGHFSGHSLSFLKTTKVFSFHLYKLIQLINLANGHMILTGDAQLLSDCLSWYLEVRREVFLLKILLTNAKNLLMVSNKQSQFEFKMAFAFITLTTGF